MHRSPLSDVSVPALDRVQEAFFRLDADGRFRAANGPCERLFSRAPGSLVGECLCCAYPEAAHNGFRELARAASGSGEMQLATLEAGQGRWFDVRIFPEPHGVSAFVRETTEEAAARDVIEQHSLAFQALPDPTLLLSPEGIVLGCNAAAEEAFGGTCGRLSGRPVADVIAGLDFPAVHEALASEVRWTGELSFSRAGQAPGTALVRAATPAGSAGAARWIVLSWVDISGYRETNDALRKSRRDFASLVENQPDIVARLDRDLRHVYVSPSLERETGMSVSSFLGRTHADILPGPRAIEWERTLRRAIEQGETQSLEFEIPTPRGTRVYDVTVTPERGEDGELESLLCIGRNVTFLRAAEARVRESEEHYRLMVESSEQVFFCVHDAEHRLEYVSPSVASVLGYSADQLVGRPCDVILAEGASEDEVHAHTHTHSLLESRVAPKVYVALTRHRLGHIVPLELVESLVCRDAGSGRWVQGFARDITERHRTEAALRDPLTGLPNRTLFMQHLASTIETASARGERLAVVFLDLDRFKLINNSAGHSTGDRLLQTVAERIQAALPPEDLLARLGGDEFAILQCVTGPGGAALDRLLERVRGRLAAPVPLAGVPDVFVTAAVGVAYGDGTQDAETLLAQADMAMYRAKRSGSRRYHVYDRTMHAETVERLTMETDLRHAIDRGQLHLAYQPMVCLQDGGIVGMEALARWTHPQRGPICPADFIPVAEDTGLIHPLGDWVLQEACRQIPLWRAVSDASVPFTVSVNLSPRQFSDGDLVERIARMCHRAGTAPTSLAVEITEGMLLDNVDTAADVLEALRAIGVRIYMDDFGTGYSSLSYVARLPIDAIKIDRSFIRRMAESGRSRQLVRSILALASALGIPAVAEGIDHPDQLAELRDMGCRFGQGYLFSAPVEADGVHRMLEGNPRW